MSVHDWLEAFGAHPQIGQNNPSLSSAHKSSTSAQLVIDLKLHISFIY